MNVEVVKKNSDQTEQNEADLPQESLSNVEIRRPRIEIQLPKIPTREELILNYKSTSPLLQQELSKYKITINGNKIEFTEIEKYKDFVVPQISIKIENRLVKHQLKELENLFKDPQVYSCLLKATKEESIDRISVDYQKNGDAEVRADGGVVKIKIRADNQGVPNLKSRILKLGGEAQIEAAISIDSLVEHMAAAEIFYMLSGNYEHKEIFPDRRKQAIEILEKYCSSKSNLEKKFFSKVMENAKSYSIKNLSNVGYRGYSTDILKEVAKDPRGAFIASINKEIVGIPVPISNDHAENIKKLFVNALSATLSEEDFIHIAKRSEREINSLLAEYERSDQSKKQEIIVNSFNALTEIGGVASFLALDDYSSIFNRLDSSAVKIFSCLTDDYKEKLTESLNKMDFITAETVHHQYQQLILDYDRFSYLFNINGHRPSTLRKFDSNKMLLKADAEMIEQVTNFKSDFKLIEVLKGLEEEGQFEEFFSQSTMQRDNLKSERAKEELVVMVNTALDAITGYFEQLYDEVRLLIEEPEDVQMEKIISTKNELQLYMDIIAKSVPDSLSKISTIYENFKAEFDQN